MGYGYMFVCCFGIDVIAEIGVWYDLCEKPSSGCRILRDFFMSSMGYVMNRCWHVMIIRGWLVWNVEFDTVSGWCYVRG